jgi:3-deoxy-D-arabino-heptulosonate 7-phosphate (DAHP) synthase class II
MSAVPSPVDRHWSPTTWRDYPALQQPNWPDLGHLEDVTKRLSTLPPLVFAGEARSLTKALGEVAEGRAFLLQAGDCAESFHDQSAAGIREKLKVILQMAAVLTYSGGLPIVKVGRIAGQFAKPRSADTEQVGELTLPSFRGHIVNDDAPFADARVPDPERLIHAYQQSSPGYMHGTRSSSLPPQKDAAMSNSLTESARPFSSCEPAALTSKRTRTYNRSTCGRATKRCSCTTKKR